MSDKETVRLEDTDVVTVADDGTKHVEMAMLSKSGCDLSD